MERRRKMLGDCPICGSDLREHFVALLGSAIVIDGGSASASRLNEAVARRDWLEASSIQEWRGDADEIEFHVLRCPRDRRLAVLKVHGMAELWANDWLEGRDVLTDADSIALSSFGLVWDSL